MFLRTTPIISAIGLGPPTVVGGGGGVGVGQALGEIGRELVRYTGLWWKQGKTAARKHLTTRSK
jgi:hypothetical protein